MENEEEQETDDKPCEPCCERCGDPTADYVVNPYLYDMYGEESYIWICDRCYKDIAGDI